MLMRFDYYGINGEKRGVSLAFLCVADTELAEEINTS